MLILWYFLRTLFINYFDSSLFIPYGHWYLFIFLKLNFLLIFSVDTNGHKFYYFFFKSQKVFPSPSILMDHFIGSNSLGWQMQPFRTWNTFSYSSSFKSFWWIARWHSSGPAFIGDLTFLILQLYISILCWVSGGRGLYFPFIERNFFSYNIDIVMPPNPLFLHSSHLSPIWISFWFLLENQQASKENAVLK